MLCPACGETIPGGARFCPSCGHRQAAQSEERRVVTVVFADVVGFTSLSERRDPEQVKHLVDRCFQWLVADIVAFGGRVDKIIGDAILALFGAPLAHEDDAERAVRAALRMQQTVMERAAELDDAVRLRIGVNTGEVLVGALAAGGDYTAMGDVVNTASRLQSAARPGEVLVGQSTFLATERVVPFEARGIVPAKGRDEPVEAWVAMAPRTAPGERPNRTVGPLIGRDAEVATLRSAASTALTKERASMLMVLGDAGMGKSRVAAEVTNELECAHGATILQGRCVPYGEVNVWWPIADALRAMLHAEFSDAADVLEPGVEALVERSLGGSAAETARARVVTGLMNLFGTSESREDLDSERVNAEATHAFVTLLEAMSVQGPVVLWLSDLHWADDVVLEMLETTLGSLARRRLAIVATARRSLLERWSPPIGRFDTVALNLEALDAVSTEALIDALSAGGPSHLGATARAELRDRSGGNPLFLVELLALLNERGPGGAVEDGSMSALPDTLRGLIAARLDNMNGEERPLIDDASVLGRRGKVAHLAEMARLVRGVDSIDAPLASLTARDLLRVHGDTWEFTSDLTREVAYGMLTKSDRANKHLGVAQWIEATHSGAWNDRTADLVAHHYGTAAELLHDLGTLGRMSGKVRERALHWIDEVSARGERLRLLPSVERLCTQGLAITEDDTDGEALRVRLELLLRRGMARARARDSAGASEDAASAKVLAAQRSDDAGRAAALLIEGEIAQQRGELDLAQSTFRAAIECYDAVGDEAGRAEALRSLGLAEMFAGRSVEAEDATTAALAAFRSLGRRSGEAWALQTLAWISFTRGRIEEAEDRIDTSLALFEEMGDSGGGAWARGLQGFIRLAEADLDAADALQRSVLADAQASGDRWASAMMLLLGSIIALWSGHTESAVTSATEGLAMFGAVHDRFGQARTAWPLARALAMRGQVDEARGVLSKVERTIENLVGGREVLEDRAILTVARASVEVHAGNPDAALGLLVELAAQLGLDELADNLRADAADGGVTAWVGVALAAGAGFDLVTSASIALAMTGRVVHAVDALRAAAESSENETGGPALCAALALACAAAGDRLGAEAAATTVTADPHASYLDRSYGGIASGLAAAQRGDLVGSRAAFEDAWATADKTGDLLTQAVVRLAMAAAAVRLDSPDATAATDDAQRLVDELGIDAHGWRQLFDHALATTD